MQSDWWFLVLPALCAGTVMPLFLRVRSNGHGEAQGVQHTHVAPTSRLGGLVVFVTVLVVLAIAKSRDPDQSVGLWLMLTALPVVVVGLWEDMTRRVRPRYRLLAAAASAILASVYASGVVPRLDLPFLDPLLAYGWLALPLTWFMVVGACNAINLIDGAHGLAAGTALTMFGGIALVAGLAGDESTLVPALAMMGALLGFLCWNYPHGRIFLGDAGAYFVGFMYAELAIRLVTRHPHISAWYVIVLAAYPIVDTLFAMYRRGFVRRRPLMAPDALHLHSLVFRRVALPVERRRAHAARHIQHHSLPGHSDATSLSPVRCRANARVAPRLWLHTVACLVFAVAFHRSTPALLVAIAVYAAFYVWSYRRLVRFRSRQLTRLPSEAKGQTEFVASDTAVRAGKN